MRKLCLVVLAWLSLAAASSLQAQSTVRVHALAELVTYVQPAPSGLGGNLLDIYNLVSAMPEPSTMREYPGALPAVIIKGVRVIPLSLSSHPSYDASSSIEPALKDSIRRRMLRLGATEKDRGMQAVAQAAASAVRAEWRLACIALLRSTLANPQGAVTPAADCTDEAAVIARAWESPPADSAEMFALLLKTQAASDLRVRDALMRVADAPGQSLKARVLALSALATLANPAMNIYSARRRQDPRCINWGWADHHAVQQEGVVPLNATHRAEIVEFLHAFGAKAVDEELAWQGQFLASCIRGGLGGASSSGSGV